MSNDRQTLSTFDLSTFPCMFVFVYAYIMLIMPIILQHNPDSSVSDGFDYIIYFNIKKLNLTLKIQISYNRQKSSKFHSIRTLPSLKIITLWTNVSTISLVRLSNGKNLCITLSPAPLLSSYYNIFVVNTPYSQ